MILSGDESRELWRLINAVDHDTPVWEALYALGCAMQRLEGRVEAAAMQAVQRSALIICCSLCDEPPDRCVCKEKEKMTTVESVLFLADVPSANGDTLPASTLRKMADNVETFWDEERQALIYRRDPSFSKTLGVEDAAS